jgi:nucleotide-binding universal stress UspA family protein
MIKDVSVHLDGSSADEERLLHAEAIAAASQAHLTGLFTNPLPDLATLSPIDGGASAAGIIVQLQDDARRQGDLAQKRLAERFSRLSVPNEIRRLEGTPGQLPGLAATEARWSDLLVASRPFDRDGAGASNDLFGAVLFESGRGVFVVPPGRHPSDAIRRILVCWRDTREAARAVAEAAPFIEKAARTTVLIVDPESPRDNRPSEPGADIARHLGRSGTSVEVHVVASEGRGIGDVILDQARRASADLIVMGGYGHSRLREWIAGGATRDMLSTSEFPILMAH